MRRFLDEMASGCPVRAILTDDPMRAKMLVAHHLDNAQLVSEQRGMLGYFGTYEKIPLSVFSVGYGEASTLAYLKELAQNGVEQIAYIGECISGGQGPQLRDVVLAVSAKSTLKSYQSDGKLLRKARLSASRLKIPVYCLPVSTRDTFWTEGQEVEQAKRNVAENEIIDFSSHALYRYALEQGLAAISILTVAEDLAKNQRIEDAERQSRFHNAARIAFDMFVAQ
ncbi:hypothetical protein LQZ18_10245 [Lachnospiraceae bacterium ZAX-1]